MLLLAALYAVAVAGLAMVARRLGDRHFRARRPRHAARRSAVTRTASRPRGVPRAVRAAAPSRSVAENTRAHTPPGAPSTAQGSLEPEPEPMVDIPVWMLEQLVASMARLEVLERRESMRLVQRERRKAAARTRL